MIHLAVLGSPRLSANGHAVDLALGKPMAALCLVALEPDGVTRADLVAFLWHNSPEERARASVRQALHVLRKDLGSELVEDRSGGIRFPRGGIRTDLDDLDDALGRGDLAWVLDHWQSGPFSRFSIADAPAFNAWADRVRTSWERRVGTVLVERGRVLLELGQTDSAAEWLEGALQIRPYDTEARILLTESLLAAGDLQAAERSITQTLSSTDDPLDRPRLRALQDRLRTMSIQAHLIESRGVERFELEFVGRAAEMATLREAWAATLNGSPRPVVVLGEAGIGKTRTAEEFLRYSAVDAEVVRTKAVEGERTVEFATLADMVHGLLSIPGAGGISNTSLDLLRQIVPSVTIRGGNGSIPGLSGAGLADAVLDLIEAVTHESPLVIFCDDIQWSDLQSRGILLRLLRSVRGIPCMFLLTCRSGEGERSAARLLEQEADAERLTLIGLSRLADRELAEALSLAISVEPEAHSALVLRRLTSASQGNPLFVQELLRELETRGALVWEASMAVVRSERLPPEVPLPSSVEEMLADRLRALDPDELVVITALLGRGRGVYAHEIHGNGSVSGYRRAVDRLVRSGLILLDGRGRISLAHDSVRDVARKSITAAPAHRIASRWRWVAAPILLLLFAAAISWNRRDGHLLPAAASWTHGTVVLSGPDGTRALRLHPDGWRQLDSVSAPDSVASALALQRREGWVHVGSKAQQGRGPDVFVQQPGEDWTLLLDRGGDDTPSVLSPDGRYLLAISEDTSAERFRQDIVRIDLVTGSSVVLQSLPAYSAGADWSSDGSRILVVRLNYALPDSLALLTPDGQRLATVPFTIGRPLWAKFCGPDGILAGVQSIGGLPALWTLRFGEEEWKPLIESYGGEVPVCSPDGEYLLLIDSEGAATLQELSSGSVVWRATLFPVHGAFWFPDSIFLPYTVKAEGPTAALSWGGRSAVPVRVLDEYGRRWSGATSLSSLDPGILAVSGDAVVGLRPGRGRLVAAADGWVADTVEVTVSSTPRAPTLLVDRFEHFDTVSTWRTLGDPVPCPDTLEGDSVLRMNGDAVYADGMITQKAYTAQEGLTAELEFRLPLTRIDRQSIRLCVLQAEPPAGGDVTWYPAWSRASEACALFPSGELTHYRPDAVRLSVGINGVEFTTDGLDDGKWHHLGLQLDPTGALSVIVDRTVIGRHPLPFPPGSASPLRIGVLGRAQDTDLLIRDLVVWRGARY